MGPRGNLGCWQKEMNGCRVEKAMRLLYISDLKAISFIPLCTMLNQCAPSQRTVKHRFSPRRWSTERGSLFSGTGGFWGLLLPRRACGQESHGQSVPVGWLHVWFWPVTSGVSSVGPREPHHKGWTSPMSNFMAVTVLFPSSRHITSWA